jgi:hypothetical protein
MLFNTVLATEVYWTGRKHNAFRMSAERVQDGTACKGTGSQRPAQSVFRHTWSTLSCLLHTILLVSLAYIL